MVAALSHSILCAQRLKLRSEGGSTRHARSKSRWVPQWEKPCKKGGKLNFFFGLRPKGLKSKDHFDMAGRVGRPRKTGVCREPLVS